MVKKDRKPRIPPGKGREWLEKVEAGIPIKEISVKEYYDPRTIKKHIREAQQEREAYQARASVLRGAQPPEAGVEALLGGEGVPGATPVEAIAGPGATAAKRQAPQPPGGVV